MFFLLDRISLLGLIRGGLTSKYRRVLEVFYRRRKMTLRSVCSATKILKTGSIPKSLINLCTKLQQFSFSANFCFALFLTSKDAKLVACFQ